MLLMTCVSLVIVSLTILLHAVGTTWWLVRLQRRAVQQRAKDPSKARTTAFMVVLVQTAWILITLHAIEVFVWALGYRFLTHLTTLEEAMYFSFTTFTTLGYGDITLEGPLRVLTGIEALNGTLLMGWSTALLFAVIQRMWKSAKS